MPLPSLYAHCDQDGEDEEVDDDCDEDLGFDDCDEDQGDDDFIKLDDCSGISRSSPGRSSKRILTGSRS